MRSRTSSLGVALGWAAAVTATEGVARRQIPSRSRAWLLAYSILGAAGAAALSRRAGSSPMSGAGGRSRGDLVAGLALASAGYPLGRVALGDHPTNPSPEPLWLETVALAGLIAPVEEIVWGALVQPVAGVVATTVLFAAKHVAIDGRWRRSLGLALFGLGLGLLRQRSRKSALLTHSACNAAGVALGHLTGRDQF